VHEVGCDSRYTRECEFLNEGRSNFSRVLLLGEAGKLLPHMLQFTDKHREEGKALQEELVVFQAELSKAIEEAWTRPPSGSGSKDVTTTNGTQNTTADLGEGANSQDPLGKITKPQVEEPTWRVSLWDKKK
jgi:elongator complex protein 1